MPLLRSATMRPIWPIMNVKKTLALTSITMAAHISKVECGVMSPQPTVVIVVRVKYKDFR